MFGWFRSNANSSQPSGPSQPLPVPQYMDIVDEDPKHHPISNHTQCIDHLYHDEDTISPQIAPPLQPKYNDQLFKSPSKPISFPHRFNNDNLLNKKLSPKPSIKSQPKPMSFQSAYNDDFFEDDEDDDDNQNDPLAAIPRKKKKERPHIINRELFVDEEEDEYLFNNSSDLGEKKKQQKGKQEEKKPEKVEKNSQLKFKGKLTEKFGHLNFDPTKLRVSTGPPRRPRKIKAFKYEGNKHQETQKNKKKEENRSNIFVQDERKKHDTFNKINVAMLGNMHKEKKEHQTATANISKLKLIIKENEQTIVDLVNSFDSVTKIKDQLQRKNNSLNNKVIKLTKQIQAFDQQKTVIAGLNEKINQRQSRYFQLKQDYENMKQHIERLSNYKTELSLRIEELEANNNELRQQVIVLNSQNQDILIEQLNQEIDELKQKITVFKEKSNDEEKMNDDNDEEICKLKFTNWLTNTVKLKQYLRNFEQNEYNDIRMIEFFDEEVIKNEICINKMIHRKLIMKQANQFKELQLEFNNMLNNHKQLKQYKQIFESYGILTLQDLQNEVQTRLQLGRMLKIMDENKLSAVWPLFHPEDDEFDLQKQNDEGQMTEYHE